MENFDNIKKLGFGLMRLPKNGDVIDIEHTSRMVDKFLEAGFTYFDTAFVYAGSEEAIRDALVKRHPRESYQLATKLAGWARCSTREDAEKQFETSLERTQAGYFDFYLLHNLGGKRTAHFEDLGLWEFCHELKEKGLIKHLGFSAHATAAELDEILTKHPEAEFVQLQINYADWEDDGVQSRKCYEVARKHNKPIIIMEPVKGGMLATPPASVEKIFKDADPDASCSSWAVRYAAGLEGVLTVLSGMSTIEQMEDNISYMKDFKGLSEADNETLAKASKALSEIPLIQCTACDYCAKVCPVNVGISGTFAAKNVLTLCGNMAIANRELGWNVDGDKKKFASECIKCGACEDACPQHISIRDELDKCVEAFGK